MKRIHTPSILIGALLGLCVVLSMGGTDDGGVRYQIAASAADEMGATVYILDTTTGQVWGRSYHGGAYRDFGTPDRPILTSRSIPH